MRLKYFHLTPKRNMKLIEREGIKADEEGNIFVFTDMIVAEEIAINQVGASVYAIFEIDRKGITGKIERDNVAESAASFQRIIKQDCIEPKFIHFVTTKRTLHSKPTVWDYKRLARLLGLNKEQVDKFFAACYWEWKHKKKRDIPEKEIEEKFNKLLAEIGIQNVHDN